MRKLRKVLVVGSMTAIASVPLGFTGVAGAQDAGNCGTAAPASSLDLKALGGLVGSLLGETEQQIETVHAPVLSPNAQSCNTNTNTVTVTTPVTVIVQTPAAASAVGGAPRFTG